MECDVVLTSGKRCGKKSMVGVCGKHLNERPNLVSVHDTIGRRPTMEDKYVINRNDDYEIYGVFDGHGGPEASSFVEKYFSEFRLSEILPIDQMAETFHEIIYGLHHMTIGKVKDSGTTASVVLIYKKLKKMIVINIGDSRVMVVGKKRNKKWSRVITKDHNVGSNKADVKKIKSSGGKVKDSRLLGEYGSVNLTRTIGDHDFSELIRLPEISIVDLKQISAILITCDGMWEETGEEIILENIDLESTPHSICQTLVQKALDDGSEDNITVMMVLLNLN